MAHPILEPLIAQLPKSASSRKLIEDNISYKIISTQLINERKWCFSLHKLDGSNRTGFWHLEQNGYSDWLKDAEEDDITRMVGVLQLILETLSALIEDVEEDD